MPSFGPVKRKDLVRYLKQTGFEGPYSGGAMMVTPNRRHRASDELRHPRCADDRVHQKKE